MHPDALQVLVVEDDPADQVLTRMLLEASGICVEVVSSLHDAVEVLRSGSFDAVVADLGLPDGSGVQGLTDLLSWSSVPVIVLSGTDDPSVIAGARAKGVAEYVPKDHRDSLISAVVQVTEQSLDLPPVPLPSDDIAGQDDLGRLCLQGSAFAAVRPTA